jgi:hypothetical protein
MKVQEVRLSTTSTNSTRKVAVGTVKKSTAIRSEA